MPVSGCCFIKDALRGGFTIFEAMASMLPLCSEFVVLDLGSTDGTLERLQQIAARNPKVRLLQGDWPTIDAGAFATLANDLINECRYDVIWYAQGDEVPHQDLLKLLRAAFEHGEYDWTFWRYQLHNNFQHMKWYPHPVHRVGIKGNFHFVNDGMSTDRTWNAPFLGHPGDMFLKWGEMGPEGIKPYVNLMMLDVSLIGGFRDLIPRRRAMHAPFWREEANIPYKQAGQVGETWMTPDAWMKTALADPDWNKAESPYNIPAIMEWHLSRPLYDLREDLFDALCADDTAKWVGLG